MGKKIKPRSLMGDEQEIPMAQPMQGSPTSSIEETLEKIEDTTPLVGNGPMTAEAKSKLEKYDALEATVLGLTNEKQELEAKVAEYIEQMSALKEEVSKLKKDLAKKPKPEKEDTDEVLALKKEAKALREEADGYLVKISELTFENANLTCQLNEMAKSQQNAMNNDRTSIPSPAPSHPKASPSPFGGQAYPYRNNGYGTW